MATATPADVIQIIDELLAKWEAFISDPDTSLSGKGTGAGAGHDRTPEQVQVVLGLVTHVYATVRYLRPAIGDGLTIVQMPLVRSTFEATLTAVWCDEVADGARAMVNEDVRQRRNLAAELAKTHTLADLAQTVAHLDLVALETSSADQARQFQQLAADIAMDGAYATYRMLSHLSHPGIKVVDEYMVADDPANPEDVEFRREPDPMTSASAFAGILACNLVWAGMVANYYDPTRTLRNSLRAAARKLGVKPELFVQYNASRRAQQAARTTAEQRKA